MTRAEYRTLRALLETVREDERFWIEVDDNYDSGRLKAAVDELIVATYAMAP